jgi:hypothetical protein
LSNNRQGGRRRGRGGERGPNLGGQPGNRQDNRQRGNAAQLLEKYKSMARDSQLAGDRVQTEYYLQFADHYFRVLGENRSRFEEQNPRRQRDDDLDDEMDGDEEMADGGEDTVAEERPERQDRDVRGERNERFSRRDRPRRDDRDERPRREAVEDQPRHVNGGGETIPFDVLPPAIGRDEPESVEAVEEEPRRPRRRTRTPRPTEGDDEIAPAA